MVHLNGRMERNILEAGKKEKWLDMVYLFIKIMNRKICSMEKQYNDDKNLIKLFIFYYQLNLYEINEKYNNIYQKSCINK